MCVRSSEFYGHLKRKIPRDVNRDDILHLSTAKFNNFDNLAEDMLFFMLIVKLAATTCVNIV